MKTAKKPWISVIVPTRDHLDHLTKCLAALAKAVKKSPKPVEVIVIDGSDDEVATQEVLAKSPLTEVNWTPAEQWWSFSRINNAAATLANGENLLLLNDDCYVPPHFFEDIGPVTADEVLGFLLVYPDGRIQHAGIDIIQGVQPVNVALAASCDWYTPPTRTVATAVALACTLIPKALFDELGGLDVEYNFGMEDVDFCLRAWERGYQVTMVNNIKCTHVANASGALMSSLSPMNSPQYNFNTFHRKWLVDGRLNRVLELVVGDGDRTKNRA